ncbi:MAG: hypothetical protein ABEJ72_09025, partial [Candidatus Aenigmatarchaeota archaeon]
GQEWNLDRAKERVSEFKKMTKENKARRHKGLINAAENRLMKGIKQSDDNKGLQRAQKAIRRHINVLENVKEKVPEQAKMAIQTAIARSARSQKVLTKVEAGELPGPAKRGMPEKVRKKLSKVNREVRKLAKEARENIRQGQNRRKVMQNIQLNTAKSLMKGVKELSENGKGKKAMGLANLAENRIQAASQDVDNEGLQRAMKVYQKHIRVLENVKEKVPEQAKDAIQKAIEKSRNGLRNRMQKRFGENYWPENIGGDIGDIFPGQKGQDDNENDGRSIPGGPNGPGGSPV